MSNDVPWLMPHNFRSEGVQKTVDRYTTNCPWGIHLARDNLLSQ
jgi:hypothetical protein